MNGADIELAALGLNCSLKASEPSNTQILLDEVLAELARRDVAVSSLRVVRHHLAPGVTSDEGPGDEWPEIRRRVLEADILVLATPIWLGNPSSVCRRVLERLNAFLGETDEEGRMVSLGRVGGVVVTGNEDGAHNVAAQLYQGLSDCGFTVPANAQAYWVGEAMGSIDYGDLEHRPDPVSAAVRTMATNLVHIAKLLHANPFPPPR